MSDFSKFVRWVKDMRKDNTPAILRDFVGKVKARAPESCNDVTKVIGFCPGCDKAMVDGAFNISARGIERPDFCCLPNETRYSSSRRQAFDKMWCKECCDIHMNCTRCDDRVRRDDSCGECNTGMCCCRCRACTSCGERYSDAESVCGECSRGYDCCSCDCENEDEEHSNVQFFESPLKFHDANKMQFKQNRSKRYVAAEIEVAGMDADYSDGVVRAVKKWSGNIVHDGSLPSSGFEINTAPANGDKFMTEIEEICNTLSQGDARVDGSCGLHVHVDARDFDFYNLKNLIRVYAAIENTLYNLVPASRKNSSYCTPCGEKYMSWVNSGKNEKDDVRYAVIRATYRTLNTKDKKTNKYDGARYNALNLHSFFFRKTVECRIFNGSVNKHEITGWGKMWAYILDYAKQNSWKDIEKQLPMSIAGLYNTSPGIGVANLLHVIGADESVKKFVLDRLSMCGDNNHKSIAKQYAAKPATQAA